MRTHYNTDVAEDTVGEKITVTGWINSIRDHGGVYFIDLRDKSGLVQLVANPTTLSDTEYRQFHVLRDEWVIEVSGLVRLRGEGLENPNLITGKIEIVAEDVKVLSQAKTLPFQPGDKSVNMDIKLKYRYLEMRDKELQDTLHTRSEMAYQIRKTLHEDLDFAEIETPVLIKSSEGGAEEVYATSKLFPGEFYSLPQSPQMYKQMLMVGGVEKYYSFAKCFRAESARADRNIEFTQIDMERAFGDREAIMADVTEVFETAFKLVGRTVEQVNKKTAGVIRWLDNIGVEGWIDNKLKTHILQITYNDAMDKFGSDKPDLRFKMPLIDASKMFVDTEFEVFANIAKSCGTLKAVVAKGADTPEKLSKKKIKALEKFVGQFGAKGLAYFQMKEEGLKGPLTKFLKPIDLDVITAEAELEVGDIIFFGAGDAETVLDYMGRLRIEIAEQLDLIPEDAFAPLWVTDFPMFENTSDGGIKAMHHPFTAPMEKSWQGYIQGVVKPTQILSDSYDLVLNGVELGGGSVRIHDQSLQGKIFKVMELSEEDIADKFGFFTEALSYGTPPHAGFAFGYDRLVSLLLKKDTIREVIAFPKAQSAVCPMTISPNIPNGDQMKDLGLRHRS